MAQRYAGHARARRLQRRGVLPLQCGQLPRTAPAGCGDSASVSIRNGLWRDRDGEIRYYVQNEAQFVGLVSDSNGAYYYIDETKKAVRGESRRVDRFRANRLLPVGTWSFGEDGAMTNAPTLLAGDDMLNGLIRLANGTVQYLQNGEPTFAGLVRSDAGDYYFIGPSKRALSNITYTFPTKYTNGLLPAGTYTFDSTGKIAQLPELLAGDDYRNGLVRMPDGKVQYFRNGQPAFAGLLKSNAGDYYFIDPTGQAVRNRSMLSRRSMPTDCCPPEPISLTARARSHNCRSCSAGRAWSTG